MHIVQIAVEFAPLVKTGGLGEVLIGLSRQLSILGHTVKVILPKYDFIPLTQLMNVCKEPSTFAVFENSQEISNTMWSANFENIQLCLLEAHHPANYFNRGQIYGYHDDAARFLYFSKAAIHYLKISQTPVDILHLHDWHTAAAACMAKQILPKTPTVLSLHNLEHQGLCGSRELTWVDIQEPFLQKFKDERYGDCYNLLKGGIKEANKIVPVSPTYAKEILTADYGCGLESLLTHYEEKITGIINGIDEILWDPSKDPSLEAKFNPFDSLLKVRQAKKENQRSLARQFNLTPPDTAPWVGAITRLVHQKGPAFLEAAIEHTLFQGGVFALLGSSPIPEMQTHFEQLKRRYKDHAQVMIHLTFDESVAHKLYAALDFTLLPSFFEPCGLAQMIGMRYGAVPIVRSTGGLKDTVFDEANQNRQNGYLFEGFEIASFLQAITRAINCWKNQPQKHAEIMANGLHTDFSWKNPAKKYVELYQKLLE